MKCLCTLFHVSCPWSSLRFQGVWVYSFHQIWGNVGHYFTCILLSLCLFCFSRVPKYTYIRLLKIFSQSTDALVHFKMFSSYFLSFIGDSSIIFIKYHNLFSEMPNLLLILLNIYLRYYNFHL